MGKYYAKETIVPTRLYGKAHTKVYDYTFFIQVYMNTGKRL